MLDPTDHAILEVAERRPTARTARAIDLGISPTRLHQRLVQLLDTEDALREYPGLVNRQRRLQEVRRQQRSLRGAAA